VRVYALAGAGPSRSEPKVLPLPDKPSIAVLPFTNMSGDPEQEYFADGVVEDIITALSRFKWLFVIARNSSFTYKGRAVDVKQVGRELGVRYVLEGSVRKAATRLRIAGQLIEAFTGAHLWADRFEGDLEQVFELQDQVTSSVVGAIAPKLQQAEMERASRKPTESLDAYDTLLRGIAVAGEVTASEVTQAQYEEALRLFHRAIELDPSYATAFAWAAQCYAVRKGNGWMADPEREMAEACRLARRAIDLGHDDAVALCLAGWTIGYVGRDLRAAATLTERALVLNPNLSIALFTSAWIKIWLGEHEQALKRLQLAQRLSPLDPTMFAMHGGIAHAHYHAGRLEDAAAAAERGLAERPNAPVLVRIAAAIYGMAGNQEEAKSALARLRTIYPDLRVSNLHELLGPYRAEYRARYEEGLRKAGLPE
jgi:TolB-like protein